MSDQERLSRIADAVTDGRRVDWKEEGAESPIRERLESLQALARIGEVHREAASREMGRVADTDRTKPAPVSEEPMFWWGHLAVLETLDAGAYGDVYRAHDPALQTDVALKLLRGSAETSEELLAEARNHAKVRHANVVQIYGADCHGDRVGLWMELVDGRTLEELIEEQGPLGPEEAARVGIDLCRALSAVHGAGLLHRDIKTSNVMRKTGGRIVLMDFSSARARGASGELDAPGGTPLFMAPELFSGESPSIASDVYALGVVLYRLVTYRFPRPARTLGEMTSMVQRGERTLLADARPDLPPAFVEVVERSLDEDPARRFATAGAMERALVSASGGPAEPAPARTWGRLVTVVAAAGALLLAAFLGIRGLQGPSLDVEATVLRSREGVEERLPAGGTVQVGDRLFMEVRGNRSMHLYVFNEDDAGNQYLLFPLPGFLPQNPLGGEAVQRLPGEREGRPAFWTVSSAGGREKILVVASASPQRELMEALASVPLAGSAPAVALPPGLLESIRRGIGGVVEATPEGGATDAGLSGMARQLARRAEQERGLWVWETTLRSGSEP